MPTWATYTACNIASMSVIHATRQALQINDQDYEVWGNLVEAYEWVGDRENASIHDFEGNRTSRTSGETEPSKTRRPRRCWLPCSPEAGRELRPCRRSRPHSPWPQIASMFSVKLLKAYERLGDRNRAIVYLRQALQKGFPPEQLNGDADLAGVIADPGFQTLHN